MLWVYRVCVRFLLTVGRPQVVAPGLPLLLCLPIHNSTLLTMGLGAALHFITSGFSINSSTIGDLYGFKKILLTLTPL